MFTGGAAGGNGAATRITHEEIIKAVRVYDGTINPTNYSKFMDSLIADGLSGLEAQSEKPKKNVQMSFLAKKLKAFPGTPEQMIQALKKAGIKKKDLGLP